MLSTMSLVVTANFAAAAPAVFTDQATFIAALPGTLTTLNFDSATANDLIPSGNALGGITFGYDLGGVSLKVSTEGESSYSSTSSSHFLGTDDADILQDGDNLSLSFGSISAIGLFVISNDAMADNDITLSAGRTSVGLVVANVQTTLPDGSSVYFLGIIDPVATFFSAGLDTAGNGEFLYNLDDLVTVPVADADSDTVPDTIDNCLNTPNPDQMDDDTDGVGNDCDLFIPQQFIPAAKLGNSYSHPLVILRGQLPYTCSLVSGFLPANLILTSLCVIEGNVTAGGFTATFTAQVTDDNGDTATRVLRIRSRIPGCYSCHARLP
jgi:hypothetical protein